MAENDNQKKRTGVILGIVLAIIALITGLFVFTPILMMTVISSDNSLNTNSCYAQTAGNTTSADGITSQILGPSGYSEEQLNNARIIDQTAADLGLSAKASEIAITTAFGESTLYNLDYGDEGHGVTNPDGTPTTSKGLFQQQSSMGWGTPQQTMDPTYATTSFLIGKQHNGTGSGLMSVPGWENMEITVAIHSVQGNSDPNHYARYYSNAKEIMEIIGVDRNRPADEEKQAKWKTNNTSLDTTNQDPDIQTISNTTNCNTNLNTGNTTTVAGKEAKNTYPWGEYGDNLGIVTSPGVYQVDPMGFYYGECTSYASWKINENMGGTKENIVFSNSYGGIQKGNGGEWKAAWEQLGWEVSDKPVPGAIAYWGPYDGEGIGEAGHVAYVQDVTDDGKAIIDEYNNSYYGPPGHRYSVRPQPVDPSKVTAFLYPPPVS